MALNPEDVGSTPSGYASPQQIAQMRELASALMTNEGKPQFMQHWTQPVGEMVKALLGAKMMQQANAREQGMAGTGAQGLLGGGSVGGPAGPGPQTDVGGPQPASVRYNNPGAMYPGPSASHYGSTGYGVIGGGHQIANFPDPESGAAAQFDLLANKYAGMPLAAAIHKWSGGNSSGSYVQAISSATGLSPDTPLTPELLRNPQVAVPLAKAMAQFETGKPYPLTDQQWMAAHARVFGGGQQLAQGGPVQTDAGSLSMPGGPAIAGGATGMPQGVTGGQTPPAGGAGPQAPQATPAPNATPQAGHPGQYIPQQLMPQIPRMPTQQELSAALLSQNKPLIDYYMQVIQAHRNPISMETPAGKVLQSPNDPSGQQYFMAGKPEAHTMKVPGGGEMPMFTRGNLGGGIDVIAPTMPGGGAQQPQSAGPQPGGSPPPSQSAGTGPGGMPLNYSELAQEGVRLKQAESEAEATGKAQGTQNMAVYQSLKGGMFNAANQRRNVEAAIDAVNDPSFTSGFAQNESLTLGRILSFFGGPSGVPASREVFNAQMAKILQSQFAGVGIERGEELGNATSGRIMKAFFDAEKDALANQAQSPEGIRRQLEILRQNGEFMISWGKKAIGEFEQHGKLRDSFMADLTDDMSKTRFTNFKEGERSQGAQSQPAQPQGQGQAPLTATNKNGDRIILKDGKWQPM